MKHIRAMKTKELAMKKTNRIIEEWRKIGGMNSVHALDVACKLAGLRHGLNGHLVKLLMICESVETACGYFNSSNLRKFGTVNQVNRILRLIRAGYACPVAPARYRLSPSGLEVCKEFATIYKRIVRKG